MSELSPQKQLPDATKPESSENRKNIADEIQAEVELEEKPAESEESDNNVPKEIETDTTIPEASDIIQAVEVQNKETASETPSMSVINPAPNCMEPGTSRVEEQVDMDAATAGASNATEDSVNVAKQIVNTALEDEEREPHNEATFDSKGDEMKLTSETDILDKVEPLILASPSLKSSGLGLLASQYDSDASDDNSESDESSPDIVEVPAAISSYRSGVIEVDSDSDSEVEFVSQMADLQRLIDVDTLDDDDETGGKPRGPMRVKGELTLDDLPPIQDLQITVPEYECVELGKVHSIVDQLVLVDSIPGTVALNLDTVLFLDKGQKVLGEVFDVLGQIASPLYCVRFNSNKQIKERGIEIGQTVFIAPRSEHTQFVILPDMLKIRGSDASWENDVEPSEKNLDYSDDEEERSARRSHRNRDRGGEEADPTKRIRPSPSPSPHPQQFHSQQQQHHPHNYHPQRMPYQRPPRYRDSSYGYQHVNFNPRHQQQTQFPPPLNYGAANGSWHTNFNQPPPQYFPAPYQRVPFVPPEVMQQALFPPPPPPQ